MNYAFTNGKILDGTKDMQLEQESIYCLRQNVLTG